MNLVKRKSLREMIESGRVIYGLNCQIMDPVVAEAAAIAGYDFLRLDCTHYPFDVRDIISYIRVADSVGLPIIARIDDQDKAAMLLDFGLAGIMTQRCQNAQHAQQLVNAYRYAPLGRRDMSKYSRTKRYGDMDMAGALAEDDREVILEIQIEDAEGLKNMEEIFEVPGIDLVCSGRNDLSQALGVPGQVNHPIVVEAEDRIIEKALAAGKKLQLTARTQEQAESFIRLGATVITTGRDLELMTDAMKALLRERNQLR